MVERVWDPEGHLATSTDTTGATNYLYDADGNRLIRRDPTGKTLYLPGQEIRYHNATGTTTAIRLYRAKTRSTAVNWCFEDRVRLLGGTR